jgi:UDP-glucose 4-epimerase
MKILVTGGTGFIGSHTVVELQNNGYEVIIIDNLSNSDANTIDSIEKITGIRPSFKVLDLIDRDKTKEFFLKNQDLKGVIHFAAYKAIGESVKDPLLYYRNNIVSLLNVIEGMDYSNTPSIVFSSSCSVYGHAKKLPVSEDAPIQKAESPYGNTKQIAEEILQDCTKVNDFKAINLRYFNPTGGHKSSLIGEVPVGTPSNLIPFITQTALGIHKELKVFGNDYNTPDGTTIRDYIHVVDVAKAHVVAINRMINNKMEKKLEVYNLGTGKGHSVLDVIKIFEKVAKLKLNYKFSERREGDVEQIWADSKLSNEVLCWKAQYNLEDMVRSAWKWEQAYRGNKLV